MSNIRHKCTVENKRRWFRITQPYEHGTVMKSNGKTSYIIAITDGMRSTTSHRRYPRVYNFALQMRHEKARKQKQGDWRVFRQVGQKHYQVIRDVIYEKISRPYGKEKFQTR